MPNRSVVVQISKFGLESLELWMRKSGSSGGRLLPREVQPRQTPAKLPRYPLQLRNHHLVTIKTQQRKPKGLVLRDIYEYTAM